MLNNKYSTDFQHEQWAGFTLGVIQNCDKSELSRELQQGNPGSFITGNIYTALGFDILQLVQGVTETVVITTIHKPHKFAIGQEQGNKCICRPETSYASKGWVNSCESLPAVALHDQAGFFLSSYTKMWNRADMTWMIKTAMSVRHSAPSHPDMQIACDWQVPVFPCVHLSSSSGKSCSRMNSLLNHC